MSFLQAVWLESELSECGTDEIQVYTLTENPGPPAAQSHVKA